jgi:hypothetical protein
MAESQMGNVAFNRYAAMCALIISVGLPLNVKGEEQDASRPLLADLMALTQLRQFKLWYAERADNWKLANYEMDQFAKTIDRMVKLYPSASSIAQANFIHEKTDPALDGLRKAIQDKDSSRFEAAFLKLVDGCNQCHKAADVGFIVVKTPTKSPYANQDFNPNP